MLWLLIGVSLILSACYHKTETTEVIPAQLELTWTESLPLDRSQNFRHTIPAEMAQQLRQIGEYSNSTNIIYQEKTAQVDYKIVFLKEIKSSEMARIAPLLNSIFNGKPFQVSFRGEQRKHVTRVGYGIFSRSRSESINSGVMSTNFPEQSMARSE